MAIKNHLIIRIAFANSEHFVSVFFDLEKAYDRTWRHGIVMDMNQVRLRGRLPLYIAEFLKPQTLSVRVGNHISTKKTTTKWSSTRKCVVSNTFCTENKQYNY